MLQSIKHKNVLCRKFIKTKDLTKRELLPQDFTKFTKTQFTNSQELTNQNTLSIVLKNKNNSRKTWDGIRSIISLRTNSHKQIRSIKKTIRLNLIPNYG